MNLDSKNHEFEELYLKYFNEVVQYAMHYTGDRQQAEDIVQEVFISILNRENDMELKKSFKSYLYTAVKNRCLNLLRDLKIRDTKRLIEIEALWDLILEDKIRDDSMINEVLVAIDKLPPVLGEVFVLKHLEMKKIHEIAREKNLNENTIKKRLIKARQILRDKLAHLRMLSFNIL